MQMPRTHFFFYFQFQKCHKLRSSEEANVDEIEYINHDYHKDYKYNLQLAKLVFVVFFFYVNVD